MIKHIEPNGDVYVQINSPGLEKLETLIRELQCSLAENFPDIKPMTYNDLKLDELYCAKYDDDGEWYRMKILEYSPCKKYANIYFVDFGNTQIITIDNEILIPLNRISDVMSQFPPQAVRVRMSIENVPNNFVDLFKNILHDDQPILLKVIKQITGEEVPLVEFYKRSEPDNILFSINKAITLEREFK